MDVMIVASTALFLLAGIGAILWHAKRLAVAFEKHRS